MASEASTIATRPRVSIIPSASILIGVPFESGRRAWLSAAVAEGASPVLDEADELGARHGDLLVAVRRRRAVRARGERTGLSGARLSAHVAGLLTHLDEL